MKFNITYFKGARAIFHGKDADIVDETYRCTVAGVREGTRFFGLPPVFPLINLFIAPNRREYDRMVSHLTKVPTGKGRLGQPQGHDLYLISPNAWPADAHPDYLDGNGKCDSKVYHKFIEHEMVHMIEEYASPKGAMEIRPQWWSEGLAVYVTGQWKDRLTRRMLKEDLAADRLPAIAEMKGRDAYVWGWSLVRFIEKRLGRAALKRVLTGSCTGDILGFLKLDRKTFEADWRDSLPELAHKIINHT